MNKKILKNIPCPKFIDIKDVVFKEATRVLYAKPIDQFCFAIYVYEKANRRYLLRYSHFIDIVEKTFLTYDHEQVRWSDKYLSSCLGINWRDCSWSYSHHRFYEYFVDNSNEQVVDYVKKEMGDYVDKFGFLSSLMVLEGNYREAIRKTKIKLEEAKFEEFNSQVDERIPNGLVQYVKRRILEGYALYNNRKHTYQCVVCGAKEKMSTKAKAKRNAQIYCPRCHHLVTLKPENQFSYYNYAGSLDYYVSFAQRCKYGMVIRKFSLTQGWSSVAKNSGHSESIRFSEYQRIFVDKNGNTRFFIYGIYKGDKYCFHEDVKPTAKNLLNSLSKIPFWLKSIKRYFKDTPFFYKYLEFKDYHDSASFNLLVRENPGRFFAYSFKYPFIEQLAKDKKFDLMASVLHNKYNLIPYKTTFYKALNMPKEIVDTYLLSDKLPVSMHRTFVDLYGKHHMTPEVAEEVCQFLSKYGGYNNETFIALSNNKLLKTVRYLSKQFEEHGNTGISYYRDYIDMAKKCNYDVRDKAVRFPQNLVAAHDACVEIINQEKCRAKNAEYEKLKKNWLSRFVEGYEDDDIIIRLPENVQEIEAEGLYQHHCVATYIPKVLHKQSIILFVRRKEKPDVPYYTLEVSTHNNSIVQCRTIYNMSANTALSEKINTYLQTVA